MAASLRAVGCRRALVTQTSRSARTRGAAAPDRVSRPHQEALRLWHVFHKPLVYVMFVIAAVHVVVALYFGYSPGS